MIPRHPRPTLFPYTTLFRSLRDTPIGVIASAQQGIGSSLPMSWSYQLEYGKTAAQPAFFCAVFNVCEAEARERDRKSTRLNSSHGYISYAVFCLKKKN